MRSDSIRFGVIAGRSFEMRRQAMREARACAYADIRSRCVQQARFCNRMALEYLQLARQAQKHEHIRITTEVENAI
jgi:hypothetical protein